MEYTTAIGIFIVLGIIAMLCKFIFFKKEIDITIQVDNCERCPFKYCESNNKYLYRCKLQEIMNEDEYSIYDEFHKMKKNCPIEKEIDIIVKERKK